jgi:cellobiose-specific phosphotransferase system component IIC
MGDWAAYTPLIFFFASIYAFIAGVGKLMRPVSEGGWANVGKWFESVAGMGAGSLGVGAYFTWSYQLQKRFDCGAFWTLVVVVLIFSVMTFVVRGVDSKKDRKRKGTSGLPNTSDAKATTDESRVPQD